MPCNLCGKWNCVCQYSQPKQQQDFTSGFFSREAMKEHSDFHPQPKAEQDKPVFHLKQYGDVTKEQLDCYIATGRIDTRPQPKQEDYLSTAYRLANELRCHLAIAPAPQQREWVGLTDDEIWGTISRIGTSDSDVNPYTKLADARAIEAKLKEKNNG